MAKSSYSIDTGSWFGSTYNFRNVSSCGKRWNDSVGKHFTHKANQAIGRFNPAHERVWEKMDPLLDLNEDEIQYSSQKYTIEGLWFDV